MEAKPESTSSEPTDDPTNVSRKAHKVHHIDLRLAQLEDLRQVAIGSPVPVPRTTDEDRSRFPMIRVEDGSPTAGGNNVAAQDGGSHGCEGDVATVAKQHSEFQNSDETG